MVPPPVALLLPFAAVAPELSPLLLLWGVIAGVLGAVSAASAVSAAGRRGRVALAAGVVTAALAAVPLAAVPATERRMSAAMRAGLGATYPGAIPTAARGRMRPEPFRAADLLSPLAAGADSGRVRVERDMPFAAPGGPELRLDVYRPGEPGVYPAIVVVPGGGWRSSDRRQGEPLQRYMAARGYVVVAVSYRHAPQARFPAPLDDVRAALAYVRANARTLEVSPERLALVGASAGGHLALLAAYAPGAPPVRAVVNYYAPTDLAAGYADPPRPDPYDVRGVLRDFMGGAPREMPARYAAASPVSYARRDLPPTLHVYGGRDHIVKPRFGRELHARLRAAGATSVYLELPWSEHGFNAVLSGLGGQLALYHTERFLAWAMAARGAAGHDGARGLL